MDVSSIAKLKLIALLNRRKSRDLLDFKTILQNKTLTGNQIVEVASRTIREIDSASTLFDFVEAMQVSEDDEIVYLDETNPQPLVWEEMHVEVLSLLAIHGD